MALFPKTPIIPFFAEYRMTTLSGECMTFSTKQRYLAGFGQKELRFNINRFYYKGTIVCVFLWWQIGLYDNRVYKQKITIRVESKTVFVSWLELGPQ